MTQSPVEYLTALLGEHNTVILESQHATIILLLLSYWSDSSHTKIRDPSDIDIATQQCLTRRAVPRNNLDLLAAYWKYSLRHNNKTH